MDQRGEKYVLRFPNGMREEIKSSAATNKRSMNAEMVARLQSPMMTLRDWFAGQALVAIADDCGWPAAEIAAKAYELADAMLEARK